MSFRWQCKSLHLRKPCFVSKKTPQETTTWKTLGCLLGIWRMPCCRNGKLLSEYRKRKAEVRLLFIRKNLLFIRKGKCNARRRCSKFTLCVYGFAVLSKSPYSFSPYFDKHQNPTDLTSWKNGKTVTKQHLPYKVERRKPRDKLTRNEKVLKLNHLTVCSPNRGCGPQSDITQAITSLFQLNLPDFRNTRQKESTEQHI